MNESINSDKELTLGFLRKMLNDPAAEFRQGQWEAISAVIHHNRKVILVQRTGWGKSFVYFAATYLNRSKGRGMTVLISPLISLMNNQCEQAMKSGLRCEKINYKNKEEHASIICRVNANDVDILIISPERLANLRFLQEVIFPNANKIGLLVVDEVHCISDWGHDFRPDYRKIAQILSSLPENTPLLGTTATANDRVVEDIKTLLAEDITIQRGELMRESLELDALVIPDQASRLAWLSKILKIVSGSGLIYVLTTRTADLVASWLKSEDISAVSYYGDSINREDLERKLLNNEVKAVVATNALGMGFDKPDISFVIHFQAPGNVIRYYQEVGRAGRAIESSYGILLSGEEDEEINAFFRKHAFPSEKDVLSVLSILLDNEELSTRELENYVNLSHSQLEKILKFLCTETPAPITLVGNKWRRTAAPFKYDHEKIQKLSAMREKEWQDVQEYISTKKCKMVFLANALDDKSVKPCGKCSSCLGRSLLSSKIVDDNTKNRANDFLKTYYFSFEPRKEIPLALKSYKFTFFGKKILEQYLHEKGWCLSLWGEGKYGQLVADQKHNGYFTDELVDYMVEMIIRNELNNKVKWVTCIPSTAHPALVPDFAKRVAQKLELPFSDALTKIKSNDQQKGQQNSSYRVRNLDGVFGFKGSPPCGSVLLIDDVYDSGWTLCIASALLRQEFGRIGNCSDGIPAKVYPVVLTKATSK